LLYSCHSERSEEPPHFAFAVACSPPRKRKTVISTEAARAFCEQRSGEIRFSTRTISHHNCAVALAVVFG
jgi:hypothetical protein